MSDYSKINYLEDQDMHDDIQDDAEIKFLELNNDDFNLLEDREFYERIAKDLEDLNDMISDFNTIVVEQDSNIQILGDNVYSAQELVEGSNKELEQAEKYQNNYRRGMFGMVVGTILGGAIFGGVGTIFGTNAIIAGSLGGGGVGGIFGYSVS